ncbi:hypothetical protein [Gemmatimonas groenlandica]|uniref:Uncharacterized protein n=1 Tax=Gemmatimonas groenlandica TaxID=2732249 RepID=A0A6M4IKD0_9BACT|nr:hypothetical protein [Gemmatimonas groenlandica]QJR35193.1 hypothetical protein HKW67_06580 [Gemmatimonas groenlandica]
MYIGALFRLFWRPAALSALFLTSLAAMAPFAMFGEQVRAVQSAVHLGLTLPLIVGVLASSAADELLRQPGSWMLPGLRRSLAAGDVLMVLALSAIVGVVAWRAGGAALAVGVAMIAPFWYAVGGAARLAAKRPKLIGASALVVLAMAAAPALYTRAVTGALPLAAAVAACATVLLMRARWSPGVARMRAAVGEPEALLSGSTAVFSRARAMSPPGHLDEGRMPTLAFWVRAAAYEHMAGGRTAFTVSGVMMAVITHLFQTPVPLALMSVSQRGLQLGSALVYPISRRERATILYVCNAIDIALLACCFTVTYVALRAVHAPTVSFMASLAQGVWPVMLAAAVALAPILQWARIRGPIPPSRAYRFMGYAFAFMFATMALGFGAEKLFDAQRGMLPALAMIVVVGVVVQLVQLAALRWVYARADLVAPLA